MHIFILVFGILGTLCGILASVYLLVSMPAMIIWKIVHYIKGDRDIL